MGIPATAKIESDEAALVKDHKEFLAYKNSEELARFEELDKIVNTSDFKSRVKAIKSQKFKTTEEYKKEREYLSLRKSKNPDSQQKLKELEAYVNSEEFKKVKDYMALKPKAKYEQSKEYKQEQEYLELKNSEKITWFKKLQKKNEFESLKKWELTFEDDFKEGSLDTGKWMTNYYWGEKLLKDTYALPGDKHIYTKGKNLEFADSVLKIVTRKEQVSGKAWDPVMGFKPQDFDYTSGLISTGKSFRQQYGRVRAKIRMSRAPVRQAMWMVSDRILPHIDVAKVEGGKVFHGNFWGNIAEKGGVRKKIKKKGAGRFTSDFFIYSVEWSPEKIVWKINEKVIMSQTQGIPQDPLYLVFSAGVSKGILESQLPSTMEIDWVKVYKKAE